MSMACSSVLWGSAVMEGLSPLSLGLSFAVTQTQMESTIPSVLVTNRIFQNGLKQLGEKNTVLLSLYPGKMPTIIMRGSYKDVKEMCDLAKIFRSSEDRDFELEDALERGPIVLAMGEDLLSASSDTLDKPAAMITWHLAMAWATLFGLELSDASTQEEDTEPEAEAGLVAMWSMDPVLRDSDFQYLNGTWYHSVHAFRIDPNLPMEGVGFQVVAGEVFFLEAALKEWRS